MIQNIGKATNMQFYSYKNVHSANKVYINIKTTIFIYRDQALKISVNRVTNSKIPSGR